MSGSFPLEQVIPIKRRPLYFAYVAIVSAKKNRI